MKLRFGVDVAAFAQIESRLDSLCDEGPSERRFDYVYLDTPDGELANHGVALRFRRRSTPGLGPAGQPWKRQELTAKNGGHARPTKTPKIARIKRRIDATFTVRILRRTWRPREGWAAVSLDRTEVSTGAAQDAFAELRIVCKRKRADEAMQLAVELGAMHLASMRARERGLALLRGQA